MRFPRGSGETRRRHEPGVSLQLTRREGRGPNLTAEATPFGNFAFALVATSASVSRRPPSSWPGCRAPASRRGLRTSVPPSLIRRRGLREKCRRPRPDRRRASASNLGGRVGQAGRPISGSTCGAGQVFGSGRRGASPPTSTSWGSPPLAPRRMSPPGENRSRLTRTSDARSSAYLDRALSRRKVDVISGCERIELPR